MAADERVVRVVRVLGVVALGIIVCGALGVGLISAWAVTRGGSAPRPVAVRTAAPVGLGADLPPRIEVRIEPVGPGSLDRRITVENPNARPVSGLRVSVAVEGATCEWVEGPFPAPFGLSPAGATSRTCQLRPDAVASVATIDVAVELGRHRVASAGDIVTTPVPAPTTAAPAPLVEGSAGRRRPVVSTPPGSTSTVAGGQPTGTTAPSPCPRLLDGVELPGTPTLAALGPATTDRARLLDVEACPDWSPIGGLRAVRSASPDLCPPWELHLDAGSGPIARLSGPPGAGCPAVPLEVEIIDQPTDRSALLATLAAWALEGGGARAPELHRAAVSGTGLACAGVGSVALGQAYEQEGGGHRVYRVTVRAC